VPWTHDRAKESLKAVLSTDGAKSKAKKEKTGMSDGRREAENKGERTGVAIETESPRLKRKHRLPARYID
jgi:hypothetical protein